MLAYVLARQDTGCKLSAPKTNAPLNAMFCGVFHVNLLTSPTPQMSYLRTQSLKAQHAAIRQANAALLPATLERVFSTEVSAHA